MQTKLNELQHLIDTLPRSKLDQATYDLYFDWSDISKLKPGQVDVLLKRLRQAARPTMDEIEFAAANSPIIKAMAKRLKSAQKKLRNHAR